MSKQQPQPVAFCDRFMKATNMSKQSVSPVDRISLLIRTVRGQKVVLDTDLALIFGVPTFRFNEAIKRNRERFPDDFIF
jgi:hypothetical protein